MKNQKSKKPGSPGALMRYLPPELIALTLALLLTTALAHLSARQADERNRKIVESGLQFHMTLQRLTATLDPEYDPARADFGALAQASKKFAGSLESMQRNLVMGSGAETLPRRLRDAIQRITEKQRMVDALTQQAEKLATVKKTLESASGNFDALIDAIGPQIETYDALALSVSKLNPRSLNRFQADALGNAFRTAETSLRDAVGKLRAEPANADLQAAARNAVAPVAVAAKAIALKYGEFQATKDAQSLNRAFAAIADAAERTTGAGTNAAPLAPDVDHAKVRAELRRARGELLIIGQQLPVVNEYFERYLDRPAVASLTELLFLVAGLVMMIALGFAWRSAAKPPVAPAVAAPVAVPGPREPSMAAEPPLAGLDPFASLGSNPPADPFAASSSSASNDPWSSAAASEDIFGEEPKAQAAPAGEQSDGATAEGDTDSATTHWSGSAEPGAQAWDGQTSASEEAVALRELLVDVDHRLADIAARAEEDSRHVEELLAALGESSQVVEQAARIQTEMADAAQSLQARAAEMRDSLPAQGAMVRQVRESLINYAAASAPTQAAGEILYALLDRLQSMELTADSIDAQLNVGIDRLAKLPEGFGTLRSKAATLLEGARQLEQAHDEALIAVGGWRDEIVAIRTRLAEAVHA